MRTKIKIKIVPLLAMLLLSLVFAPASHAVLTAVGPTDPATQVPAWYQDATGLSLAPCFDNNGFCSVTMVPGPAFDPALPPVFPANFPDEGFYFYSTATSLPDGTLYLGALEFALLPAGPTVPPQTTFARIRFDNNANNIVAGDYVMTHPFGVDTVTVTPDNVAKNQGLRFTEDILPVNGVFTGALGGRIGPFLRKATGLVTSPDGNVYVGDSIALVTVTGAVAPGVNSFTVAGPLSGTTNLFTLEGKVIGMSVTPTTIAFPAQRPGIPSAPVTVTVANLSAASTLVLAAAPIAPAGANAADFTIAADTCSNATIPANGTCTFNVVFNGGAAGPVSRTSTVTVSGVAATVPKVSVTPITGIIDAVAPTVLTMFPDGATAPANVAITAVFDESMLASSISNTTITVLSSLPSLSTVVNGTVVYSDANKTMSFTPTADFTVGAVITAQTTTFMTDLVGNPLAAASLISFATTTPDRTPPTITSINPANNETGTRTSTPITVVFSEPMLATSITGSTIQLTTGGVAVTGTVTLVRNVATFTPSRPLEFGTAYTLTIASGALDLVNNALATGQVNNFVTNFAPIAPVVVSPANGATGVALPVVLRWKPSTDQDLDTIQYHLFLCNNQNFIGTAPNCLQNVTITPVAAAAKGIYYASVASGGMLFTLFGLSFAAGIKGRKKILLMIAVLVITGLFVVSCSSKSDDGPSAPAVVSELTHEVAGLAANLTYYWKLEADDGKGGVTTTPVMTFTTQ